jgi:hypothetical protein
MKGNYQLNDYVIPNRGKEVNRCYFVIKFLNQKNAYAIKDMGDDSGTFLKISYKCTLKKLSTICFGDIHFTVTFNNLSYIFSLIKAYRELNIKFIEGPLAGQLLYCLLYEVVHFTQVMLLV